MNIPTRTQTPLLRLSPELLGSKAERDAFAQRMLLRETEALLEMAVMAEKAELYRERMAFADLEAEQVPEGRMHVNTRINRKTD